MPETFNLSSSRVSLPDISADERCTPEQRDQVSEALATIRQQWETAYPDLCRQIVELFYATQQVEAAVHAVNRSAPDAASMLISPWIQIGLTTAHASLKLPKTNGVFYWNGEYCMRISASDVAAIAVPLAS